jgi:molybdopterin molybdotransferase
MLSVKEAQEKVINSVVIKKTVKVPIIDSLHMVLAEDIISRDDIPAYDNSSVDGFAVKSIDVIGAEKNYPVKLKLLKEDIPAGTVPVDTIESGMCMQIMTGAPVPKGCDCVVMKEDVLKEGRDVLIFKECREGENIRFKGEDIKKNDVVLKAGKKIFPADIGIMSSTGTSAVFVFQPPVVAILPTGDELIGINEELSLGKVRDSNSYSLSAQIKETGAFNKRFSIVKDDKELIRNSILSALDECDILILTGGVSVGDYDYVKEILDFIGAEFVFWRVNQRPGKPMAFLTYKDKFIFGLPGNPVSVMVCFEFYVRPLIKLFMGEEKLFRKKILAKSSDDFKHKSGRTDFIRVKLDFLQDGTYFKSTGMQGSGILMSMSEADGLAIFPESSGNIEKDMEIEVLLLK